MIHSWPLLAYLAATTPQLPPAHPEATVAASPARALPQHSRGVVLTLHDADPRRSYVDDVVAVRSLGCASLSVVPTWRMATIRSSTVVAGSATDAQIVDTLAAARKAGMSVLVAPMIQLDELARDEWRGVIAPPDWDVWFASYDELILHVAELAETGGAAGLLVGSELCSTETFTARWLALIARIRRVFHGALGYQANWDHRDVPGFLGQLDFVASNAYFELVKLGQRPTVEQLLAAWRPFRAELDAWATKHAKPLVITEVGYPSISGCAAYPWDYTRTSATVDLEEQRRAYLALFGAWQVPPAPHGVYVYEWWGTGGPEDCGYTPRGKPAEQVLREWLKDER